jgi:hypothetical protein
MKKLLVCLCVGLFFAVLGCHQDECEAGRTKCDGNRLFFCTSGGSHSADYSKWREEFNCSEHGAVCKEGKTIRFDPYGSSSTVDDYYSHGCAIADMACEGDTDMYCFADNSLIVACSYSNEPTAMIVAENESQHPLCVEQSNGLARFAYLPGECVSSNESSCFNDNLRILCEHGVWARPSVNCGMLKQNLKCETTTDSEGYTVSQCVNADPCDAETGEYGFCLNDLQMYRCAQRSDGIWGWFLSQCSEGDMCRVIENNTTRCYPKTK